MLISKFQIFSGLFHTEILMELLDLSWSNTVIRVVFDVHIFIITYVSLATGQHILKLFKIVFQLIFHSLHIFSFADLVAVEREVSLDVTVSFTPAMLTRGTLILSLIGNNLFLNILRTLNILTLLTNIFVRRRSHHFLCKSLSLIHLVLVNLLLVLLKYLIITFDLLVIWNDILALVSTLLWLMIIILMMLRCHFDISKIL